MSLTFFYPVLSLFSLDLLAPTGKFYSLQCFVLFFFWQYKQVDTTFCPFSFQKAAHINILLHLCCI